MTITMNEYHHLTRILSELKEIMQRESKRHEMDEHLTPHGKDLVEEMISMLEEELDYDPTPNELGEPPITAVEMHAAAWKEHQAMHS